MSDRNKDIVAFVVASVLVGAATWIVMSAAVSFVRLEWRFITSTGFGRALFLAVWLWLNVVMLQPDKADAP